MAILESTQPKNLHLDEPNVEEGLLSSILSDAKKSLTIEVLFKQASTLQISGQWERARHLYQMWLSQEAHHPQKHLAMYNYGAILQSCGDLETAHKVYAECVSLCPKLAQAHINLGLVYESLGKIDQAIAQWSLLVSQQHQDASVDPAMLVLALNHIGRVHENQKDMYWLHKRLNIVYKLTLNKLLRFNIWFISGKKLVCGPSIKKRGS